MIFIIIVLFFLFLLPVKVNAADITLSNSNLTSITDFKQEYEVDVSLNINVSDDTKYFLRGMFYKEGTNGYCGYTWNGQSWFNGPYSSNEGWNNLPEVLISSSSGQTRLKSKLDFEDKDCQTRGTYFFKIQRFTRKGSAVIDEQNGQKLEVLVEFSTPTAIPSNTPSFLPSLTPKKTRESAVMIPSITLVQSTVLPGKNLISPTQTSNPAISEGSTSASIAGIKTKSSVNLPFLLLVPGLSLIFISSFLSARQIKKI